MAKGVAKWTFICVKMLITVVYLFTHFSLLSLSFVIRLSTPVSHPTPCITYAIPFPFHPSLLRTFHPLHTSELCYFIWHQSVFTSYAFKLTQTGVTREHIFISLSQSPKNTDPIPPTLLRNVTYIADVFDASNKPNCLAFSDTRSFNQPLSFTLAHSVNQLNVFQGASVFVIISICSTADHFPLALPNAVVLLLSCTALFSSPKKTLILQTHSFMHIKQEKERWTGRSNT